MFYRSIIAPFLEVIAKYENCTAFCIDGESFTYRQFVQRVATIAAYLKGQGDQNVALIANDHLDTYASIFAIWFSGKTYVPLNPETPIERNKTIIDQVGINVTLDSTLTQSWQSLELDISVQLLNDYSQKSGFENQLAYIFYTSGSTGIPKGVMITKENVAGFVEAFWEMGYDITENDRCLQMFELTFDLSVMSYLIPLLRGASVYTIPKGRVKYSYIYELMEEKELTIALMVPSILNYLRPYFDEILCPKMRYSLFCGEALRLDVTQEWAQCLPNARIDNVYGPTEDTIFCTYYTFNREGPNEAYNGILSIGKSMKGNYAVVFGEDDRISERNEVGELCLAGVQLTPGYFNNNSLNKEMFFSTSYNGSETRFYRTGDLCILNESGNINYIGRKDFQVKIQGFRVELSEIELYAAQAMKENVAVVALATENTAGNYEIALIFESGETNITELKEYLKNKLPAYMIPTQYFFINPFPLNINGKVDRKKLKEIIRS